METKNIPTIVMLVAGFVISVVMYINHYDLSTTLKTLLVVFFVFYLIGLFVKKALDKFCMPAKEGDGEEDGESTEEEPDENNEDGSVIEKN